VESPKSTYPDPVIPEGGQRAALNRLPGWGFGVVQVRIISRVR